MKFSKYYFCLILVALSLIAFSKVSAILPDTVSYTIRDGESLPVDPAIVKGKFSNGLTYFIRENQKPENRAQLWLVLNAGSVLEDEDQQGLAHFTEHMAFNGTKHFAKQEIINYLQSVGMKFGPEINAYTGFDETFSQ